MEGKIILSWNAIKRKKSRKIPIKSHLRFKDFSLKNLNHNPKYCDFGLDRHNILLAVSITITNWIYILLRYSTCGKRGFKVSCSLFPIFDLSVVSVFICKCTISRLFKTFLSLIKSSLSGGFLFLIEACTFEQCKKRQTWLYNHKPDKMKKYENWTKRIPFMGTRGKVPGSLFQFNRTWKVK